MKTQDIKELDVNKITNEIIDTISSHYEEEIKILHKALELASYQKAKTFNPNGDWEELSKMYAFDFIQQAKESIDE